MRMESLLPLLTRSINFVGDGGREAECILSEADRQRAAPQPHLQAETAGSDQRLERPPPSPATAAAMRSAASSRPSRLVPASPSRSHPGGDVHQTPQEARFRSQSRQRPTGVTPEGARDVGSALAQSSLSQGSGRHIMCSDSGHAGGSRREDRRRTKPESTDQPRVNQVAKRRQVPSFLGECELRNATEPHRERHLSDAIFSQPRALVSSLL